MELNIPVSNSLDNVRKFIKVFNSIKGCSNVPLSDKEIEIAAIILFDNFRLIADNIKDLETRMEVLFTKKNKEKLRNSIEFSQPDFETYLSKLRKKGFFESAILKVHNINDLKVLKINYVEPTK
jgi:hypothetical protein